MRSQEKMGSRAQVKRSALDGEENLFYNKKQDG